MADLKISELTSLAGSSLANTDVLAVVDTSASETKKITSKELVQYGYGLVDPSTLDGNVIEPGTTSARGTVQLTDSTGSTSTTTAATPNAVKSAYDLANAALPKAGGTMTGQILGDDSTNASTPGYAFDGDPNTGIYSPGADQLAISTGGTGRLFVDASGNVGIGTAPTERLTVNGGIDVPATHALNLGSDQAGGATLNYNSNGNLDIAPRSGYSTVFLNTFGGSELVRITSDGKVGIGTSSPGAKLHVSGTAASVWVADGTKTVVVGDWDGSTNYIKSVDVGIQYTPLTHVAAAHIFKGPSSEYARIDSSGRVGIGTSTPGGKLVVSDGSTTFQFDPVGGTGNILRSLTSAGARDSLLLDASQLVYSNGGTERLRCDSSGRLLVGTNTLGPFTSILTLSYDAGTTNWSTGPYSGNAGGFVISANASYGVYLATTTSTAWATASDERLKTDLRPIEDGLEKVGSLRAVTGRYAADAEGPRKPFLIAQDVLAVLPEAVDTSNPEKYGLAYTEIIPLLVAALKESKERIEALEAKVAALESA